MGRTANEISRIREAGDHPAGRAIASANQAHAGETRHSEGDLLPLVRSVQDRWTGSPRRSLASAGSGLEPHPGRSLRERIVNLALDETDLSPRELAVRFTDTESYFVSEASVYRLLKARDLIASPGLHRHQGGGRVLRRPPSPTSSGRPTLPTSRLSAGAGSICRPCSTTSPATSSPGSCAPP